MTNKEKTALAMLSSGASFKEVSDLTGIQVERVMELWQQCQKAA